MFYHGTTIENLNEIKRIGLRKESWCSQDINVAIEFAKSRSAWNGYDPIVIAFVAKTKNHRRDRSNQLECQTISPVKRFNTYFLGRNEE